MYDTNLLKNIFTVPPDTMRKKDPDFFHKAADYLIPLLYKEIEEFKNVLSRIIFPFPHLPGLSHDIYQEQMAGYLAFMKKFINL